MIYARCGPYARAVDLFLYGHSLARSLARSLTHQPTHPLPFSRGSDLFFSPIFFFARATDLAGKEGPVVYDDA